MVDVRKLSLEELVFLFFAFETSDYDETLVENDDDIGEEFSFDFLKPTIISLSDNNFPIKEVDETFQGRNMYNFGGSHKQASSRENDFLAWHYLDEGANSQMLDIYLQRDNKLLKVIVSTWSKLKIKNRLYKLTI